MTNTHPLDNPFDEAPGGGAGKAIAGLVIIVALVIGGFLLFGDSEGEAQSHATYTPPPPPATVTTTARATTEYESLLLREEYAPRTRATTTRAPAPAPETKTAPTSSATYIGSTRFWHYYTGSSQTSAAFARNVAEAMEGQRSGTVAGDVYSSTTGQSYYMTCTPDASHNYTCRGGNNAVVYLERNVG